MVEIIQRNDTRCDIKASLKAFLNQVLALDNGGSYSKHTYVSGLSDIDVLVNLGTYTESTIPNKDDPSAVLKVIESALTQV